MVFGASPNRRIQEEGPTDGNGSWKSSDTTDRHAQASCRSTRGNPRDVEEAGGDRARRSGWKYRQCFEERRAHPHWRARHPSGTQTRRAHWPQSCDRRADPDQGEQKGRLPRVERIERVDLTTFCPTLRGITAGAEQSLFACRFFWNASCRLASERGRAIL